MLKMHTHCKSKVTMKFKINGDYRIDPLSHIGIGVIIVTSVYSAVGRGVGEGAGY